MFARLVVAGVACLLAVAAMSCSSDKAGSDGRPGDAASDAKETDGAKDDASTDDSISTVGACEKAGGQCECSCGHPFSIQSDEHNDCPQPCATCGGCSMFCCLPDPDCDATLGCVKVCQAGDCECQCPLAKTPCGDSSCDRMSQVCVGKGPIGPSVDYACADVPTKCALYRDCNCLSGLCNEGDTCSVEDDNKIFCDNGSQ